MMSEHLIMADQIEGDTLTCGLMDLDGSVIHTFTNPLDAD